MFPTPGSVITLIRNTIHRLQIFLGMPACTVTNGFCICQGLWKYKDGSIGAEPNGQFEVYRIPSRKSFWAGCLTGGPSYVTIGYMKRNGCRQVRLCLGLTQEELKTTCQSINRYENGTRRMPGMTEVALSTLETADVSLAGVVAAGAPIEPFPQTERVEVPKSMIGRGDIFALRVNGNSMRDEGILPGDVVVVQKQATARNGQTVIALVNGEATIKTYRRNAGTVELHPANETMQPIVVQPTDVFHIEGIVVGVIRHLRK